ncbi:MAG TPA: glycosyltransferase [Nocardioidaceae bacterium]|nr:glycosyltransferase [Nocardioidaceae bacterium]
MAPRFSIVTPVYDTPPEVLRATLQSVSAQTFTDWELCVVDDSSPSPHILEILRDAAASDHRVKVVQRADNGGIVAASNDGVAAASGEFIALLDHDDMLHPDALRLVDEAVRAEPEADYVYTDEDKVDEHGRRSAPFYKPDWSPERLRTQMYTCHLSVLRRSLVDEVGGFDAAFEGSQDWDLVLRVTERARKVLHVPQVLYHWRLITTSTAARGEAAKPYAYDAGTRVLQAHCDRIGFLARVERDLEHSGVYHLDPALVEHPPVSIVIPTNGGTREVRGEVISLVVHCVRSIVETSTYPDFEIVVVADEPTPPDVLAALRAIAGDRLRIERYDHPFNFADKINLGVLASKGEQVLMLNDDMEVVTPDWIERMVMYSALPGIGAVGAKLLFGDGRLQHVGVMMRDASPGHLFRGFAPDYSGYANVVRVANNYSAVTGACLMTPREVFDEVGGLSLMFPLSFNDVDYCLKVRAVGQRVVYDPDTVLYHFESSSRSPQVSDWELAHLRARWAQVAKADPYDNPNFHPSSVHMVPPVYLADGEVLV